MGKRASLLVAACLVLFLFSPVAATPTQQPLTLGAPATGSLAGTGDEKLYEVTVPAGQRLTVLLDGADNATETPPDRSELYIKFGKLPTLADYDKAGDSPDADQAVEIASTQAGTYFVMVRSASGGGAFSIVAHTAATFPTLTIGEPVSEALQGTGDIKYYQVTKAAAQRLTVLLDGADNATQSPPDKSELYIKFGKLPTLLDHDDVGDSPDADQAVEITTTVAGTYYVMVRSGYGGGDYSIAAHDPGTFPTLALEAMSTGALQGTGDIKYYQVVASEGGDLTVILDGADPGRQYHLYLKFGRVPTLSDHERGGDAASPDQEVRIRGTRGGAYYVMVRSADGGGDYTIVARAMASRVYVPMVDRTQ